MKPGAAYLLLPARIRALSQWPASAAALGEASHQSNPVPTLQRRVLAKRATAIVRGAIRGQSSQIHTGDYGLSASKATSLVFILWRAKTLYTLEDKDAIHISPDSRWIDPPDGLAIVVPRNERKPNSRGSRAGN